MLPNIPANIPECLEALVNSLPTSESIRGLPAYLQHHALESPLLVTVLPSRSDDDFVCSCPLCPGRINIRDHFDQLHWQSRLHVGAFTIFPCFLRHKTTQAAKFSKSVDAHFHCPACPSFFASPDALRLHHSAEHETPSESAREPTQPWASDSTLSPWYSGISPRWYVLAERTFVLRAHPSPTVAPSLASVRFSAEVEFAGFPLAVSMAEKRGSLLGDAPRRVCKYVALSQSHSALVDKSLTPPPPIFVDCVFLLVGRSVSSETLGRICQLGGVVSGAQYLGGADWRRFTHALVGAEVACEKLANLWTPLLKLSLVDQDWINVCAEVGHKDVVCDLRAKLELTCLSPAQTSRAADRSLAN